MDTILEFFSQAPAWITALLSLMVAAKAIVALTPTPRDDEIVGQIYKIVEFLALNFGKAKDKPSNVVALGGTAPPPPPGGEIGGG